MYAHSVSLSLYMYLPRWHTYIYTIGTKAQEVVKSKTEIKKTSSVAIYAIVGGMVGGGREEREEVIGGVYHH